MPRLTRIRYNIYRHLDALKRSKYEGDFIDAVIQVFGCCRETAERFVEEWENDRQKRRIR